MLSEQREILRKRASEASLILRNLALEKKSLELLLESKRLRKLMVDFLQEGEIEGPEGEETTEIRLYLLEVLELVGEQIPLVLPGYAIPLSSEQESTSTSTALTNNAPPPPISLSKPEPLDSLSVRLFPLLVALTCSQDRSLVLASYRCLTVLSLNEKSDQIFSILTFTSQFFFSPSSLLAEKFPPHPVETAIELLPISDYELNSVLLDFLYQHTLLPSNSVEFCHRKQLKSILKLICSKFEIGAKIEKVETKVLLTNSEATKYYKLHFGESLKKLEQNDKGTYNEMIKGNNRMPTGEPLLSDREVKEILNLQEPDRAINWMHRMYEIDPDSDITQVSLWTTYKTQFETITSTSSDVNNNNPNANVPIMLAAQEVIRLAGQAFPSAVPTIVDDSDGQRKFIIKGLKPRRTSRRRETLLSSGECGWQGCKNPTGHGEDTLSFHQHVYNSHLSTSPTPTSCRWSNCTYTTPTSSSTDPALQLGQITLHTRTHLPLLSPPPLPPSSSSNEDEEVELPISKTHHVRYHAQVDDHHEATGPGFLACLILRNLTRTAKLAKESITTTKSTDSATTEQQQQGGGGGGRVSVASGNAAIGRLAEGEQSIFEAFALAEESATLGGGASSGGRIGGGGSGRKGAILQQIEKPDWSLAVPAIEALCDVEDRILKMALSNVVLGKYLVEVVTTIEGFKRSQMTNVGGRMEEEDVKMEE